MSENEVRVLNNKVDRILGYLYKDEGTGEKGLIADFKLHEKKFNDFIVAYEKAQAVKKATIGAYATIGGMIALVIKWVAGLLLEHFKF